MENHSNEQMLAELGLKKITAYVHEAVACDAPAHSKLTDTHASPKPAIAKTEAYRKKLARERQKEMGLTQFNIIIRNSDEIREKLSNFAKRLLELDCWNEAIAADPSVQVILASLEHAKIRLVRIDDLEERHRRAFPFIQFHNDLMVSRGFRRFFLYLAGVVPFFPSNTSERDR